MDQETKQLLEENLRISKENNELLLKIRKVQVWSQITRFIYWFVLIAVGLGAFYFVQPYLNSLIGVYTGGVSNIDTVKGLGNNLDINNLQQLIKDLQ